MRDYEQEISRDPLVPQSLEDDLRASRQVEGLVRKATELDMIHGHLIYISTLLKHSPFPALDRHHVALRDSGEQLSKVKYQMYSRRVRARRLQSVALARKRFEDWNATQDKFNSTQLLYESARNDLTIFYKASGPRSVLRRSAAYTAFCLRTQHELRNVKMLDYNQRLECHAMERPARLLFELSLRR